MQRPLVSNSGCLYRKVIELGAIRSSEKLADTFSLLYFLEKIYPTFQNYVYMSVCYTWVQG